MKKYKLDEMTKGWFIGNFHPSVFKTNDVEVGIKKYKSGDWEGTHHHKIATEFTVILDGRVEMNGQYFESGDIVVIKPGEDANFKAVTDVTTVVVKLPGANNDKYC